MREFELEDSAEVAVRSAAMDGAEGDDAAGIAARLAAMERTEVEEWARYLVPGAEVRRRGAVLRRRRRLGAGLAAAALALAVVAVATSVPGAGRPGEVAAAGSGPAGSATGTRPGPPPPGLPDAWPTVIPTVRPTVPGGLAMPGDDVGAHLDELAATHPHVSISGTLPSHSWTVLAIVFDDSAALQNAAPWLPDASPRAGVPAVGKVALVANYDGGRLGGVGRLPLGTPAAAAIPDGTQGAAVTRVDPWYSPKEGVVISLVAADVTQLVVVTDGQSAKYRTYDLGGRRFVAFPVVGPGLVTSIAAMDATGRIVGRRDGPYLPLGVFPDQLPPGDQHPGMTAWGSGP